MDSYISFPDLLLMTESGVVIKLSILLVVCSFGMYKHIISCNFV